MFLSRNVLGLSSLWVLGGRLIYEGFHGDMCDSFGANKTWINGKLYVRRYGGINKALSQIIFSKFIDRYAAGCSLVYPTITEDIRTMTLLRWEHQTALIYFVCMKEHCCVEYMPLRRRWDMRRVWYSGMDHCNIPPSFRLGPLIKQVKPANIKPDEKAW